MAKALHTHADEFGTYAYLSWCLENAVPLPVDLLAVLESRGWIIEDREIQPAEVAAMAIITDEETLDLFDQDYEDAKYDARPCDTEARCDAGGD